MFWTATPYAGRCVHQPSWLGRDELDVHAAGLDQDPDEAEGLWDGAQVRGDPSGMTGSIDPVEADGLWDGAQVRGDPAASMPPDLLIQ